MASAEASRPVADLTSAVPPSQVRRLTEADLPAVIARDDRIFGAHRRILLEWALHGAEQYAHVIDAATNKVVGVISGIEVNHGAAVAPDGSRIYISNEADSTLDVVDGKTLKVTNHVPLSGHPNNIAIGKDGRRVYVGIIQAPGGVDVIDTVTMKNLKTLPTKGTVSNNDMSRAVGWTARIRLLFSIPAEHSK